MSRLHISLDDTKGIFKALCSTTLESVFETRTLRFLQDMHNKYGTVFYMYCTCVQGDFSLEKVPEYFRSEFEENGNWLKFGFHCHDEIDKDEFQSLEKFKEDYYFFQKQMLRITGQTEQVEMIRTHGFRGNKSICEFLKKKGVHLLLASDDNRVNYYLNERENEILITNKSYIDEVIGLEFVRSCTRLEDAENILLELDERKNAGNKLIPVFTHEWQMDKEAIREKMKLCCEWGARNDINENISNNSGV